MPLSQKARNLAVSTFPTPTTTMFRSTASSFPIEPRVASAGVKKSTVQLDGTLRDIKRRYEDEAKQVQQNYEVDFNNHLSLIKTVEELQILLEDERRRSMDLENKYNGVVIELEKERRLRMDFEYDNGGMGEELRRAESILSEYELKISRLQQDGGHLDSENKCLRNEIHRLTDLFNSKIREVEEKYLFQVRDLASEVERYRNLLEQQKIDSENRIRELDRDWSAKYARQEDVIREKERLIAELEAELKKLTDRISQVKIEYEEEMRRQVMHVREEEHHKFQIAIKTVDGKLHQVEGERDHLIRKNQDLVRELHLKERQIQDLRMHFDAEGARLKAEIHDLRNKIGVLTSANEKLHSDISARDTNISRLESEIINVEREINRLKEIHTQELNRLVHDHVNDRKRGEEGERMLKNRIAELERIVRSLETDNVKLRADIERIKEQVTGNVHKTIFKTFVDYETTTQNVKPLY